MEKTRRAILRAGAGTATMAVFAGCSTDDSAGATDDDTEPNETESDDDDSESNDPEPEEHTLELLAEENVDHEHACLHSDFDDRTPLSAADSSEDAPIEGETHVIWEVTYEGEEGYVAFDADAHEYDGPFVFYTAEGSAEPVEGSEEERDDVPDDECDSLEEYVVVDPADGEIVLALEAS